MGYFLVQQVEPTLGIAGLLYANGTPVGGDFINLWAAGRLVLEGRIGDIYDYVAFMDYEIGLTGAPIGMRFWAYPPHSLLLAWPFGALGFYPSLLIWSLLGLVVLALGCRKLGLDAIESAIVLCSPASVLCLYYGQTGNLGTGLLLLALARGRGAEVGSVVAAVLLTMKPQMGFLLPLHWLVERRWTALILTSTLVLTVAALTLAFPGIPAWLSYLSETLPALGLLEQQGTGPFMWMIPSLFMAFRIVTGDGDLALWLHLASVVPILVFAVWRLWRLDDPLRRAGLVLAATALVTPYLHNYDLTLVAVAGLIVLRRFPSGARGELAVCGFGVLVLALPQLVPLFNSSGLPLGPLLILPLLLLV
jgi:alpha-1,2-mannosyltransferase